MSPRRSVRIRRMPVRYGSTMQPPATSNGQRNTRGQGPKPKGRAATRNKSPDNSPRMYSSGQVDRASGSVLPVAHDNRVSVKCRRIISFEINSLHKAHTSEQIKSL